MILALRTDKPQSEIYLLDESGEEISSTKWEAHRQLAETIHSKLMELLQTTNKELNEITGIVIYQGPGSFTGLRIGMSVTNALAFSMDVPVLATNKENWLQAGIRKLEKAEPSNFATPVYGTTPNITKPKK